MRWWQDGTRRSCRCLGSLQALLQETDHLHHLGSVLLHPLRGVAAAAQLLLEMSRHLGLPVIEVPHLLLGDIQEVLGLLVQAALRQAAGLVPELGEPRRLWEATCTLPSLCCSSSSSSGLVLWRTRLPLQRRRRRRPLIIDGATFAGRGPPSGPPPRCGRDRNWRGLEGGLGCGCPGGGGATCATGHR